MGAGGSQEASYDLQASVPAGTYHVVLDGIVTQPVDVQFDLLWRRAGSDTTLATWQLHFEPSAGSDFDAQAVEVDEQAPAIDFHTGDQLVFRYTGSSGSPLDSYIPDGDGAKKNGRDPNITLPHEAQPTSSRRSASASGAPSGGIWQLPIM